MDAAATIFLAKGYHATSVQDIAEALGILKGSIYYYIDSKEDLLFEIVRSSVESMDTNIRRVRGADLDPLVKLRALARSGIRYQLERPVEATVVVRNYRDLTGERLVTVHRARERLMRFVRDRIIVEGQRAGTICPDIEPVLAARGVLTMLTGMYEWALVGRHKADTLVETYADMVIASVACDRKRHRQGHRGALAAMPDSPATADLP